MQEAKANLKAFEAKVRRALECGWVGVWVHGVGVWADTFWSAGGVCAKVQAGEMSRRPDRMVCEPTQSTSDVHSCAASPAGCLAAVCCRWVVHALLQLN